MFQAFFILFLAIPLLEIFLLLRIGSLIGPLPTILTVVATAVLGAWLLRIQGFSTWRRLHESLQRGEIPAIEMVEGLILLVGGALLLTPGFFTDAVGFLCLLPPVRRRFAIYLIDKPLKGAIRGQAQPQRPSGHRTIEGEYKRED
jgi:UPF0716 protein FxsA